MKTPVLLVGLGAIGCGYDLRLDPRRYAQTHARAFSVHPMFDLVGGVDPDAARRAEFSGACGVAAYPTVAEALAVAAPELVVIATPTSGHADALDAVLAGCRPRIVLCEKPLADTPARARAMQAACEAAGVELFVNYFRRALPAVLEVRQRMRDGRIGVGAKAVGWYTKGLLHNGSHLVDLLGFWLGGVEASRSLGAPKPGPAGPDLDCQLRFARGEAVLLSGWQDSCAYFGLELLAREGRLAMDSAGELHWQAVVPDPAWPGYHSLSAVGEALETGMERYQWHVAEQLARRLHGADDDVLCTGTAAIQAMETIDALIGGVEGRPA